MYQLPINRLLILSHTSLIFKKYDFLPLLAFKYMRLVSYFWKTYNSAAVNCKYEKFLYKIVKISEKYVFCVRFSGSHLGWYENYFSQFFYRENIRENRMSHTIYDTLILAH